MSPRKAFWPLNQRAQAFEFETATCSPVSSLLRLARPATEVAALAFEPSAATSAADASTTSPFLKVWLWPTSDTVQAAVTLPGSRLLSS